MIEVFGFISNYAAAGEGTQYDYYKAGNSRVKNYGGSANAWWERSPVDGPSISFCCVNRSGYAYDDFASTQYGIAFAFCL